MGNLMNLAEGHLYLFAVKFTGGAVFYIYANSAIRVLYFHPLKSRTPLSCPCPHTILYAVNI